MTQIRHFQHFCVFSFLLTLSIPASSLAAETNSKPSPVAEAKKEELPPSEVKKNSGNVLEKGVEAISDVGKKLEETRDFRAKSRWIILGNYSLMDMWIPSKIGVGVSYIPSAESAWELEYLRASMSFQVVIKDLGKMTDERISLIRRSYSDRNSFNFFAGVAYHAFTVSLGDRLTSLATNRFLPNLDLVKVKTLGIVGGLGNRWQFKSGWAIGVDWISMYLPLKTLEAEAPFISNTASESGKSDVKDVMDIIKRVPTLAILKLQVGISF
jgi:hypothetical protein